MRGLRAVAAAVWVFWAVAGPAVAGAAPPEGSRIRSIAFEGNETTRAKVMLRELVVAVGDRADPQRIERSRQAIEDLGLFRSVTVREEPVRDGVRLVFVVRERWYVLPVPRLSYDSDRKLSYGGQLTWNNVAGLNHTLKLNGVRGDAAESGHGIEQSWSAAYNAPFLFDSPWTLALSGGHRRSPVEQPQVYDEYFDNAEGLLTRRLSQGPASQGWSAGGGLSWRSEETTGAQAPAAYGEATALVVVANYRNLRYHIFSEQGTTFAFRGETAFRGLSSDYGYEQVELNWRRYLEIGQRAHQSLNFFADTGAHFDGPAAPTVHAFALGGRNNLRAYPSNEFEGNAYYRVGAEYLRSLHWDWLRALVVVEAGNVFEDQGSVSLRRIRTSLGVGLRARVTWLVNFEFEAGVAIPLDTTPDPRFFGGRT